MWPKMVQYSHDIRVYWSGVCWKYFWNLEDTESFLLMRIVHLSVHQACPPENSVALFGLSTVDVSMCLCVCVCVCVRARARVCVCDEILKHRLPLELHSHLFQIALRGQRLKFNILQSASGKIVLSRKFLRSSYDIPPADFSYCVIE